MNYIIDFERVNQLTSHPNDNPNSTGAYTTGTFCYSISRKYIKDLIEFYLNKEDVRHLTPNITWEEVVDILVFNKVLISKSDIRDRKINELI